MLRTQARSLRFLQCAKRWPLAAVNARFMATATGPGSIKEIIPEGKPTGKAQPSQQLPFDSNKQTETNKLEKTMGKFWEKVGIKETPEGFHIQLDGKTIKTPLGNEMIIPLSKKTLAYLVFNEWKNLRDLQIKPYVVPLTSLVSRAVDLQTAHTTQDIELLAKIGNLDSIREMLLRYLDTDTLLVFSPAKEYEGTLRKAQEERYRPIIKTIEEMLGPDIKLTYLDSDLHGLRGNKQAEETHRATLKYLEGLDVWELVALEKATLSAKSLICGMLIIKLQYPHDSNTLSLEDIAQAATLETIYQTDRWGEVEDTHDVDKVDIRRNLASCALVAYKN